MTRIKFYSKTDMSVNYYLEKSEKILLEFEENKEYLINDILEMKNIIKYFDNNMCLPKWSDTDLENYRSIIKKMKIYIYQKINELECSGFLEMAPEVEFDYIETYIEIFSEQDIYKKCESKSNAEILAISEINIRYILKDKALVEYFSNQIRDYFLNNAGSAILLLEKFTVDNSIFQKSENLYFPKNLTHEDKEKILLQYLQQENTSLNLNYVRLIAEIKNNNNLGVSPETRYIASCKAKELQEGLKHQTNIKIRFKIIFDKMQNELKKVEYNKKEDTVEISYSSKWVIENNDNATLLNTYIYLFEFVDSQNRIGLVSKFNESTNMEKCLLKGKSEYLINYDFYQKEIYSDVHMRAHYRTLKENNIHLEDAIQWFFCQYLKEEFSVSEFQFSIPTRESNYFEKCRFILPEIENVLRQYSMLVEKGEINQDMLVFMDGTIRFKDVKSFISANKYFYLIENNAKLNGVMHYLFSDQSRIAYNPRTKLSYSDFYSRIKKEKIYETDFRNYNIGIINFLIEEEIVYYNNQHELEFCNNQYIEVLKDFYENEVISYYDICEEQQIILIEMMEQRKVFTESKLLTKPEVDYLNYCLNDIDFSNSLAIRNKYSHGNQGRLSEEECYRDYLKILKLIVLLMIKINEDLYLRAEEANDCVF